MLTIAMCYFYYQVKDKYDLKTPLEDKIRVMVRSAVLKTPISTMRNFQMPLSNFPKTFGLDLSLYSKGDFPFKFNTFANRNYVESLPDIEHFCPDTLSEKSPSKLIVWHNDLRQNNYIFDFQKEMYKYCAQDVTILRLCCLRFRDLF